MSMLMSRSAMRVVLAAAAVAAFVPATAMAAPPTLTGEVLSELDPSVTGACDPAATSTMSFEASGFVFGPYEVEWPYDTGGFTETGTATVGPQPDYQGGGAFYTGPLTAFSASFVIQTPDAKITGTKFMDASTVGTGICQEVTDDPDLGNAKLVEADVNGLRYEARIVTAEGTFLDRGTTYVHVDRLTTDIGNPYASFSETFQSSLTETIRIPTSEQECRGRGFRDFPALGFRGPRDCLAYLAGSTADGG